MLGNTKSQVSCHDVRELCDEELSHVCGGIILLGFIAVYKAAKENAHKEIVNLSDMNIA
jgi:hypothetical protein